MGAKTQGHKTNWMFGETQFSLLPAKAARSRRETNKMASTSLGNFVVLETTYDEGNDTRGSLYGMEPTVSSNVKSMGLSKDYSSVIAITKSTSATTTTTQSNDTTSVQIPTDDTDVSLKQDLSPKSIVEGNDRTEFTRTRTSQKMGIASSPNKVDFFPEPMEVSEEEDDEDESDEDGDEFDPEGVPLPRISSSTIPIVLEVAPRNGRLASNDPLFHGVCLYSGSMSTDQVEAYSTSLSGSSTGTSITCGQGPNDGSAETTRSSWLGSFSPSQWLK